MFGVRVRLRLRLRFRAVRVRVRVRVSVTPRIKVCVHHFPCPGDLVIRGEMVLDHILTGSSV